MNVAGDGPPERNDRRHVGESSHDPGVDYRTPAQRDRDRILQSSALRRLADVTQVVAPMEGHAFHNRLTHTIKVAQIAKRLAQRLLLQNDPELVKAHGGLDPDAVEAASLAHDLGHPPFGHVAEQLLDRLLQERGLEDGFEGNAQSFRIITKLAIRSERHPGLNLTRATLDASMKYPWQRHPADVKFGAYRTETKDFQFARALDSPGDRSLDAEIMDWADDIAYSVHDLEDFYKAGLLPLHDLTQSREIRERFLQETRDRWLLAGLLAAEDEFVPYAEAFHRVMDELPPITEAFMGTTVQRARLRTVTSFSHHLYSRSVQLSETPDGPHLDIPENIRAEVTMLKELTWHYVIHQPGLATLQHGQKRIIGGLFHIYADAMESGDLDIFPQRYQAALIETADEGARLRMVTDTIATMTDQEAQRTHARLTGRRLGSLTDSIPY